jgi:hypothetical protein
MVWIFPDLRFFKVSNKLSFALNTTISNSSNFLTIKSTPATTVILVVEIKDESTIYKIDESVTHVSIVFKIYWEIEEVVSIFVRNIYFTCKCC